MFLYGCGCSFVSPLLLAPTLGIAPPNGSSNYTVGIEEPRHFARVRWSGREDRAAAVKIGGPVPMPSD